MFVMNVNRQTLLMISAYVCNNIATIYKLCHNYNRHHYHHHADRQRNSSENPSGCVSGIYGDVSTPEGSSVPPWIVPG